MTMGTGMDAGFWMLLGLGIVGWVLVFVIRWRAEVSYEELRRQAATNAWRMVKARESDFEEIHRLRNEVMAGKMKEGA